MGGARGAGARGGPALVRPGPGTRRRDEPAVRIDLLIGLGTAQRQVGGSEFRATLLEAARLAQGTDDTERLVTAALANYRGFTSVSGEVDAERVEVLQAALRAVGDDESPRRARLLARLCSEFAYRPLEERVSLEQEAKTMARQLGDPGTLVAVINDCSLPLRVPSTLGSQLADIRESLEIAERIGDPLGQFWASAWTYIDATRAGDFTLAERCLALGRVVSARLQEPTMLWAHTFQEASFALQRGEPDRAEELATKALEIGSASEEPDAFTYYGSQLMCARDQQGRLGELVDLIAEVAEQNPGMPVYGAILPWAHNESGDEATARVLFDAAAERGFDLPQDSTWLDSVICYASIAVQLHLPERCGDLFALLAPFHDQAPCQGVGTREPVAIAPAGWPARRGAITMLSATRRGRRPQISAAPCATPKRRPTVVVTNAAGAGASGHLEGPENTSTPPGSPPSMMAMAWSGVGPPRRCRT